MKCSQSIVGSVDNKDIIAYNVKFENGFEVEILNLGGVITKIIIPDKDNNLENIVLAYKDINDYVQNPYYYGGIIGRTSGRICEGKVKIKDKEYELNNNYGLHQGHGGNRGFNHNIWNVDVKENTSIIDNSDSIIENTSTIKKDAPIKKENYLTLTLSRISLDKEENYPGNLHTQVIFNIYENYKIEEIYKAKSDKTTLVNMTNHSYFNLSGNIKRPVTESYLKVDSDYILELDETCVPTGKSIDVKNTPFDFRKLKLIGKDIDNNHEQIKVGNGYDHVFMLNKKKNISSEEIDNKKISDNNICIDKKDIFIEDKECKRNMTISTNQESVVIYTMNWEHEKLAYTDKVPPLRHGICFETQAPPIGRNMCFLENSLLNKDEEYVQKTVYTFGISK